MKLERQRLTALSVLLVAAALVRGDEDKQRIIDQRSIFQGHQAEARSVAYAPGGKILASGGLDNALVLWDVRTGRIKHTLRGGKEDLGNGVCSVAFSPDGKIVAGGGEGSQVRLWDTGAGELLLTIRENRGAIHSIAFAPDGKTIASVGNDLVLCDARTGEFKLGLEGATILWSVCFSPDGKTVAAGGHAEIRVWVRRPASCKGRYKDTPMT
jgi:WD40 repeat protein